VTARALTRHLFLAGILLGTGAGAAGEELGFFEDESFSFEAERKDAPPRRAGVTAPSEPPQPPSVRTSGLEQATTTLPAAAAGVEPERPPTRRTDRTPPAPQSAGGVVATPGPAAPRPQLLGGELHVEILRVRELTDDERQRMRGKLRCADPLAADVRPDARTRSALARLMDVPERSLPATVSWIFGRRERCFQRPAEPLARHLDALDAAARRVAPAEGSR